MIHILFPFDFVMTVLNAKSQEAPTRFWHYIYTFSANNRWRKSENSPIPVSFQPTRTLQQEFPKPKDKLDTNRTRDIVYKIECSARDPRAGGAKRRARVLIPHG